MSFGRIRTFLCLPEVTDTALSNKVSPLFKSKSKVSIKNFSGTYDHIETPKNRYSNGIYNNSFLMDEGKNGVNGSDKKPVERLKTKEFIDCEKSTHVVNCVNGFCKDMKKCKIEPSHNLSDYKLVLKNIDFECVPGDLVAIVGPVGSGKTSILMAILNEINCVQGNVNVLGRVSFACQEAWVFAGWFSELSFVFKKRDLKSNTNSSNSRYCSGKHFVWCEL